MRKYEYFSTEDYEIIEKQECYTYGLAPVPFMAYGVKTGIVKEDDEYVSDIIKWMPQREYEIIVNKYENTANKGDNEN